MENNRRLADLNSAMAEFWGSMKLWVLDTNARVQRGGEIDQDVQDLKTELIDYVNNMFSEKAMKEKMQNFQDQLDASKDSTLRDAREDMKDSVKDVTEYKVILL